MHKKNNNKTKSFIQGLRPFSSIIPTKIKKNLKKNGYNFASIVDNWTKIVGKDISDKCFPINIKINKLSNKPNLVINVLHGKEVAIEYNKNSIIDKINTFFGYNYIENVELKLLHTRREKNSNNQSQFDFKIFDKDLEQIKDLKLKRKLNELIKAYNEKNN